jgi:Mrp family chromosome partitioning ATPase
MNEISWEDPYQRYKKKWGMNRSVDTEDSKNEVDISVRNSNSFADRFLAVNREKSTSFDSDVTPSTYHGHHHVAMEQDPFDKMHPFMGSSEPDKTDSGYIHSGRRVQAGQQERPYDKWHFFDLMSRKQTGDLYKKIIGYKKKSSYNTFCFTSTTPKEGVTTILANLAHYIRNQGSEHHVLLVDANLESPGMDKIFGIPAHSPGLIEVLEQNIDLESALVPVADNISVLCGGHVRNFSRNNLDPEVFSKFIQECKTMADYLLVDCPPILVSSDAFSVAPASDITFLVVQAVKVRRQVAEKGISELRNYECEIGGIIMNRVQQVIPSWVYRYI